MFVFVLFQQAEIETIISNWSEEQCIGKVILNHADVLCKVYPPFVNYFEMCKETVTKYDRENPRFHAFLKACISKAECGRQSLAELLIRPVQRLPSMNLLLSGIEWSVDSFPGLFGPYSRAAIKQYVKPNKACQCDRQDGL